MYGEVYRLHEPLATLARLDRYEGCSDTDPQPAEYVRIVVETELADGGTVSAHIYVYQREVAGLRRIESGDYLNPGRH